MKAIVYAGIILMLAGCGVTATVDQSADSIPEGWYSQEKTDAQRSQDLSECQLRCLNT